jgi:HEPN domain-containing protein
MCIDKEFKELLNSWIPLFDEKYTNNKIEINQRPFRATIDFIKYAVTDIKNSTKEEQLSPPWFGYWHENIYAWYEEKYGDALKKKADSDNLKSFIIINKIPYILNIPNKITLQNNDNKEYWLLFPNELQENENVFNWIINKPNLEYISKNQIEKIQNDIILKCNFLRNIWVNLLITDLGDKTKNNLLKDVLLQLEYFSDDIIINLNKSYTNSIWELSFAVEKSLKSNIYSKTKRIEKTHDLHKLYNDFIKLNSEVEKKELRWIPEENKVIKYRYGEIEEYDIEKMNQMYLEGIEIIDLSIKNIEKEIKMKNLKMLIKNPYYK